MITTLHRIAGFAAPTIIATFWLSTVAVELFGTPAAIAAVKWAIVWALPALVVAMATAGITGNRLARSSRAPVIVAKRRRMAAMAALGVLVMIPCALLLADRAAAGTFDAIFTGVQGLELVAGAVNLTLAALNARAGRTMTAKRRWAT